MIKIKKTTVHIVQHVIIIYLIVSTRMLFCANSHRVSDPLFVVNALWTGDTSYR